MAADILDTLRSPVMALYEYEADGGAILLRAADEIGRLRHDLDRAIDGRNKEAEARIAAERKVGSLRSALQAIDENASCECGMIASAALTEHRDE